MAGLALRVELRGPEERAGSRGFTDTPESPYARGREQPTGEELRRMQEAQALQRARMAARRPPPSAAFDLSARRAAALAQETQRAPEPDVPRVGRNDPCPCGSGKKYKKCHGAV